MLNPEGKAGLKITGTSKQASVLRNDEQTFRPGYNKKTEGFLLKICHNLIIIVFPVAGCRYYNAIIKCIVIPDRFRILSFFLPF
jgi:hypothetical protein